MMPRMVSGRVRFSFWVRSPRTSSSRKNGLPSARSASQARVVGASATPPSDSSSRSHARAPSLGKRTSSSSRSAHRFGYVSLTSGRAKANTISGWSLRLRSPASRYRTLGGSAQCRSSTRSSTGACLHSIPSHSTKVASVRSAMSCGSRRAARKWGLASSGKGTPMSSPMNSTMALTRPSGTRRAMRLCSFCCLSSSGSLLEISAHACSAGASTLNGVPMRMASARPVSSSKGSPRAAQALHEARSAGVTCRRPPGP